MTHYNVSRSRDVDVYVPVRLEIPLDFKCPVDTVVNHAGDLRQQFRAHPVDNGVTITLIELIAFDDGFEVILDLRLHRSHRFRYRVVVTGQVFVTPV